MTRFAWQIQATFRLIFDGRRENVRPGIPARCAADDCRIHVGVVVDRANRPARRRGVAASGFGPRKPERKSRSHQAGARRWIENESRKSYWRNIWQLLQSG